MKNSHYHTPLTCLFKFLNILFVFALFSANMSSCRNANSENNNLSEDAEAKKMLQGIWINEDDGSPVFLMEGDTIKFADCKSEPVFFYVRNDSLHLQMSSDIVYLIKKLSASSFNFVNSEGDEVCLIHSNDNIDKSRFNSQPLAGDMTDNSDLQLNQNTLIKRDSVLLYNDKRFHAYIQVNPTRYKLVLQKLDANGVSVENVYYDNIIHISLYEGSKCIYSHDIKKNDFIKIVPDTYLSTSVLSDIEIRSVSSNGVEFEAIIIEPESYTSYRVKIILSESGKITMKI